MSSPVIRVLVVDDHPVVRSGTRALLAQVADIEVVGDAGSANEAFEKVTLLHPDVVLMDLVMPDTSGLSAIEQITNLQPDSRILILTSFALENKVLPAFKAGAAGYLTKEADPMDIVKAIREVHRGQSPIQPSVARKALREWAGEKEKQSYVEALTKRELDVLYLMARGHQDDEIAQQLGIGEATVRTHVNHVVGKLQVANRVQAVLWAVREGLAPTDGTSSF